MAETTGDQQRANNGRDSKGRFVKGNDKAFKPGVSGNPKGRPRSALLSDALRAQLAEAVPNTPDMTLAELLATALIRRAAKGDVAALREVADRTEGKARQALDIEMNLHDWRELARAHGIPERDVIDEAKRIIEGESVDGSGDASSD